MKQIPELPEPIKDLLHSTDVSNMITALHLLKGQHPECSDKEIFLWAFEVMLEKYKTLAYLSIFWQYKQAIADFLDIFCLGWAYGAHNSVIKLCGISEEEEYFGSKSGVITALNNIKI